MRSKISLTIIAIIFSVSFFGIANAATVSTLSSKVSSKDNQRHNHSHSHTTRSLDMVSGTISAMSDTSITIVPAASRIRASAVTPLPGRFKNMKRIKNFAVEDIATSTQPVTIPITRDTLIVDKTKLVVGAKATVQEITPSNGTPYAQQVYVEATALKVHPRASLSTKAH